MPQRPPKHDAKRNTQIALFRYGLIAAAGCSTRFLPAALEKALPDRQQELQHSLFQPHTGGHHDLAALPESLPAGRLSTRCGPQPRRTSASRGPFRRKCWRKAIALREEQPARTTPMMVQLCSAIRN